MFVGIGVGIRRQRFAGSFATSYSSRVIANGGTIEALDCVVAASSLLQSASLLIIPSGYKASVVYAELPANGNGDLTWTRNSVANRTQSDGTIGSVAANVPRLSYMYGSCPALLLEPQRTNSIRNSTMQGAVAGSPGTLPTNWLNSNTAGLTRSIAGVGIENGIPYVDIRFNGTANSTSTRVDFDATNAIPALNAQVWTNSIYSKIVSQPNPAVSYELLIIERSSAGIIVSYGSQFFTPTTSLQRFALTWTLNGGGTVANAQPSISINLTNGATYDFTIRIAAPQLELGAFATTWINTTNAAATRLADSFTRNNIFTNGLISASGGTWFIELRNNVSYTRDNSNANINLDDAGGFNNGFLLRNSSGTGRLSIQKTISGSATQLFLTTTDNVKIAIKWNGTSADVFVNGVKQVSATAFTTVALQNFITGIQVPVFIQQMALYPTPLSDADCITLTT
jgi:hypothetical protein